MLTKTSSVAKSSQKRKVELIAYLEGTLHWKMNLAGRGRIEKLGKSTKELDSRSRTRIAR